MSEFDKLFHDISSLDRLTQESSQESPESILFNPVCELLAFNKHGHDITYMNGSLLRGMIETTITSRVNGIVFDPSDDPTVIPKRTPMTTIHALSKEVAR